MPYIHYPDKNIVCCIQTLTENGEREHSHFSRYLYSSQRTFHTVAQYSRAQHTIHIIRRMNVSWLSIEMLYSSFVYVIKNILSPSEWSISLIRYRFLHYYEFCSAHFSLMCLFQFGLSFGEGRSNKFPERYVDL